MGQLIEYPITVKDAVFIVLPNQGNRTIVTLGSNAESTIAELVKHYGKDEIISVTTSAITVSSEAMLYALAYSGSALGSQELSARCIFEASFSAPNSVVDANMFSN